MSIFHCLTVFTRWRPRAHGGGEQEKKQVWRDGVDVPSKRGFLGYSRYRLGSSSAARQNAENPTRRGPHCDQTDDLEAGARPPPQCEGSEAASRWQVGIQQTDPERVNHCVGGSTTRRGIRAAVSTGDGRRCS
jgi:hypothetical protein